MLVLIPYLLFGTGFILEVSGDLPSSIALNHEMDYPRFNEQELFGKRWLLLNKEEPTKVFADHWGWVGIAAWPYSSPSIGDFLG